MPGAAVLTVGDQVPVIPFVDVVGNTGATAPWHTGATEANVGTIVGAVTVTDKVAVVAHCPALGVKV